MTNDKETAVAAPRRKSFLRWYWLALLLCLPVVALLLLVDFNHPRLGLRKPQRIDPKEFLPDIADKDRMDKALQHQGDLSPTHLTVRWSAGCRHTLPHYIELKIPREYLSGRPIFFNSGCVEKINLGFVVPGSAPWSNYAQREKRAIDPKALEARAHGWPREVALTLSAGGPRFHETASWRREVSDAKTYLRAENVAGLERYERFSCVSESDATNHPGTRDFLAAKPPTDRSPQNCWTVPGAAIMFTPSTITSNDEVVKMRCSDTGCTTYFAVGLLQLSTSIWLHQLERWREVLDEARALARTFVVYESVDAFEVGVRTLR